METLLDVLTQYAEENQISRFLREIAPQFQEAEEQVERLTEALKAMSPAAEERVKRLTFELDTVSLCRNQAFLLSGISIGLRLGQL